MIRTVLLSMAITAMTACAYSEEDFTTDYIDAYCTKMSGCEADILAAYTEMGLDEATAQSTFTDAYALVCESEPVESEDTATSGSEEECEFNSDNGKTCVAEIEEMSCDVFSTGEGFPETCNSVCD